MTARKAIVDSEMTPMAITVNACQTYFLAKSMNSNGYKY